jgi:hypothetical protein
MPWQNILIISNGASFWHNIHLLRFLEIFRRHDKHEIAGDLKKPWCITCQTTKERKHVWMRKNKIKRKELTNAWLINNNVGDYIRLLYVGLMYYGMALPVPGFIPSARLIVCWRCAVIQFTICTSGMYVLHCTIQLKSA